MDTAWQKSSYSGRNPECVECRWQKSSYSTGTNPNCVETRTHSGSVHIRDTQNRHQGHLTIPAREWTAFLSDVDRL